MTWRSRWPKSEPTPITLLMVITLVIVVCLLLHSIVHSDEYRESIWFALN